MVLRQILKDLVSQLKDVVKLSIRRHARWLAAAMAIACWLAPISAHEVIVEQIVDMRIENQGSQLVVTLRVPAAVAGDSRLPALLKGTETAGQRDQLRVVAADIAHNLDVRQGSVTLADPIITARADASRTSLEVELRYPSRPSADRFSARINAFSSKDGRVRTVAHYQPGSGRDQVVDVTGAAVRVTFDPLFMSVVQQFAVRGLRALFDGGDHLLFLVCLLLPMRRARAVLGLVAAVVLGQAGAMIVSVNLSPMNVDWMAGSAMVAASAIVIATLQGVVRARMRWTIPIALVFGVLNGCLLAQTSVNTAQFGGAHATAAMFCFAATVLIGELWLAALAFAFRAWLDERGLPDPVVAIIGLAMVAHQALHRVADRAQIVAQGGSMGDERVLLWLTLAWIGAVLLAAASNAVAGAPVSSEPDLGRVEGL
jgi:hypothetical protein